MLLFIVSLVLSLPNLVIGLALLVVQHTFSTRDLLQMVIDFLFGVTWGIPVAALVLIVLLLAGCISETRSYAAVVALVLNLAALILVLIKGGGPRDFGQAVFFLPIFLVLIGLAWLAYRGFAPKVH